MTHTIEFISSHPLLAFISMVAIHLTATVGIYEFQLPTIVMQLFQILAFTSTIVVGIITFCKFIKKEK